MSKIAVINEVDLHQIIKGCVDEDRASQKMLYEHFYRKMFMLVRTYISCPYVGEEVLNTGFLRAFKKIHQYNYQGSFEGWLRRVIFHAVADHVKADKQKKKGHETRSVEDMSIVFSKNSIDMNNGYTEMCYRELLKVVDSLPMATRSVFHMIVYEGYTHKQVGDILGVSEGTSKWHLSEGKRILREKITKLGLHVEI